jgi:hypothetical protein
MTQLPIPEGARTDRWQLAAGGTVYAPRHPLHLDVPGFWDEVESRGRTHTKLLCVSFVLDPSGGTGALACGSSSEGGSVASGATGGGARATNRLVELDPYLSYWYWYPDRIEARYYLVIREGIGYKQQAGVRVFLDEKRRILPDGSLQCELSFDLLKQHPAHLDLVAWGLGAQLDTAGGPAATSTGAAPAPEAVVPRLVETPFFEQIKNGRLTGAESQAGPALSALHWRVALDADAPVKLVVNCLPHVA